MTLQEIRRALVELAERIKSWRRLEANKIDKKQWTDDLVRARDLIDLVDMVI